MNIGLKIKKLVTDNKMSVVELSEKIGKSRQTTYDMLEKPHVSSEILVKLSDLFNLPIEFFFTEDYDSQVVSASKKQQPSKEIAQADKEKARLIKELARERKAREEEKAQLASLIAQNAKLTDMLAK